MPPKTYRFYETTHHNMNFEGKSTQFIRHFFSDHYHLNEHLDPLFQGGRPCPICQKLLHPHNLHLHFLVEHYSINVSRIVQVASQRELSRRFGNPTVEQLEIIIDVCSVNSEVI